MSNDFITFLNEKFENDKTGETVNGITIIIDGKLKNVIDKIIQNNSEYSTYSDVVRDALLNGINSIIKRS